ncbi:hypothetical protein VNO77_44729 [Canavalia gladiata]|uniref:Uncharacterized protein n=1 Tax=Canavalia gladiata TaxID=3824 RepID=A0AAN9JXJ3_CANGL
MESLGNQWKNTSLEQAVSALASSSRWPKRYGAISKGENQHGRPKIGRVWPILQVVISMGRRKTLTAAEVGSIWFWLWLKTLPTASRINLHQGWCSQAHVRGLAGSGHVPGRGHACSDKC